MKMESWRRNALKVVAVMNVPWLRRDSNGRWFWDESAIVDVIGEEGFLLGKTKERKVIGSQRKYQKKKILLYGKLSLLLINL